MIADTPAHKQTHTHTHTLTQAHLGVKQLTKLQFKCWEATTACGKLSNFKSRVAQALEFIIGIATQFVYG